MPARGKPSIVFCHGIWANGSSFSKVIPRPEADGYEVIASQYGLDTAQADVDTVIRTLGRVSSPSILVGHSYGGAVITAAGTDDRVVGLAYIAALGPDETRKRTPDLERFAAQRRGPRPTRSKVLTSGCSPTPTSCLT